MKSIQVNQLKKVLEEKDPKSLLLDVRTKSEYRSEHIQGAKNIPLDQLSDSLEELLNYEHVYVQCRSGNRSSKACQQIEELPLNIENVEGGIEAWKQAGFDTITSKGSISLMRQVQIAAGSLVLIGYLLSLFLHPAAIYLSVFVGAGLLFAGLTNTCGMGMLLSKMPWNK